MGVAVLPARADAADDAETDKEPTQPEPPAARPQICLSDVDIEGEVIQPPSDGGSPDGGSPDEAGNGGPSDGACADSDGMCFPQPCLSFDGLAGGGREEGPRVCLSIYVPEARRWQLG